MNPLFSRAARLLGASLIALLSLSFTGCHAQPEADLPFQGTDITGTHLGQGLAMTDSNGHARTLKDYQGQVLLIFFGYTQCPDVCPTSMAMAAQALEILGDRADQVQVLMITVDPQRDSAEILRQYVKAFDPSFEGLRGTPEQLETTARAFKAHYEREPGPSPDQYGMGHSAAFYLLDQDGEARSLLSANTTPQEIAHDIDLLLD